MYLCTVGVEEQHSVPARPFLPSGYRHGECRSAMFCSLASNLPSSHARTVSLRSYTVWLQDGWALIPLKERLLTVNIVVSPASRYQPPFPNVDVAECHNPSLV